MTYSTTGYLGDFVLVEPIADSLEGTGYEGLGHKKRADPIGPALCVYFDLILPCTFINSTVTGNPFS